MVAGTYRMLSGGAVLASPVVADGLVYAASMDGNVYAIE